MKEDINPVILFSIKEASRIEITLFKAKWEAMAVQLATLLKINISYENFSRNIDSGHSFKILWVVSSERLYTTRPPYQTLIKNLKTFSGAYGIATLKKFRSSCFIYLFIYFIFYLFNVGNKNILVCPENSFSIKRKC